MSIYKLMIWKNLPKGVVEEGRRFNHAFLSTALLCTLVIAYAACAEALRSKNNKFHYVRLAAEPSVNFASTEAAVLRLQIASAGALVLNANVEAALAQSVQDLPLSEPLSEQARHRYRLLLHKSISEPAATEFGDLLFAYASYRYAARALPPEPTTLVGQREFFEINRNLRSQFFPRHVVGAVFGASDALNSLIFELRALDESDLSAAIKEKRRGDLQIEFDKLQQALHGDH